MKKFINDVNEVVNDSLDGLVAASNREVYRSNLCSRVVLRKNSNDKVSLIAGGGSGHEPYAAGYVGCGLLTGAVAGNVFASPPSKHVLRVLEESKSEAGSILFVINYTGDRLNFGLAAEKFKGRGNDVRIVTIADDIAIDNSSNTVGRRGLAGAVLVIKIAGAMAEANSSIDDIEKVSNTSCKHTKTICITLYPCSLPGQQRSFEIGEDQMEVGSGIHGEPGRYRTSITKAEEIVRKALDLLFPCQTKSDKSYVMVLNNLGSTSVIEMNVLQREVVYQCERRSIRVERLLVGSYMTSLDGHGISITCMEVFDDRIVGWIDAPTTAIGWKPSLTINYPLPNTRVAISEDKSQQVGKQRQNPNIGNILEAICQEIEKRESELNLLDGKAGDGDCGSTFLMAGKGIRKQLKDELLATDNVHILLQQIAEIFEEEVGGTSGAIYATLLNVISQNIGDCRESQIIDAIKKGHEAVQKYGGARPGDRTMVDAMEGFLQAVDASQSKYDWESIIEKTFEAAQATKSMVASSGRASYTSKEAQQGSPDAGAMAVAYWLKTIWITSQQQQQDK